MDKLVAKIAASSGHLTVGFLGVENLPPVLVDFLYRQVGGLGPATGRCWSRPNPVVG